MLAGRDKIAVSGFVRAQAIQTEAIEHIRIIVRQKTAPEQIVDLVGEVVACLTNVDASQTRLRGYCVTRAAFGLYSVLSGREFRGTQIRAIFSWLRRQVQAPVLQIQFESLGWPLPRRRQVSKLLRSIGGLCSEALQYSISDRERRA